MDNIQVDKSMLNLLQANFKWLQVDFYEVSSRLQENERLCQLLKLDNSYICFIFPRFPDLDKTNTSQDQQKFEDATEHVIESYVDAFIVSIKADTKKWDW